MLLIHCIVLPISELSANDTVLLKQAPSTVVDCDPLDPILDCDGDGTLNKDDENPTNPCIGWTIQLKGNDCDGDGITVKNGDPDDYDHCNPIPQPDCKKEEEEYEEEEIAFEESSDNQQIVMHNPCPIKEGTNPVDCDNDGTTNDEDEDPLDPCVGATVQLASNDCDGDGVTVGDGDPDDFDFCVPNPIEACQDNSNEGIVAHIYTIKVQVKAFLQGAYNEDDPILMHDKLRLKELIPIKEPYTSLIIYEGEAQPFVNVGERGETTTTEVLAKTGPDAIVDWVFLELHDPIDAKKIRATRAALIQRDGDVVDVDGLSPVVFSIEPGSYYLALRHRNHLGVMTANPIAFTSIVTEKIDFTNTKTPTYQLEDVRKSSAFSQRQIDNRNYLWGGNSNADHSTIYQGPGLDQTKAFYDIFVDPENIGPDGFPNYNFILRTYSISDSNLDGEVRYQGPDNDVDDLQFFNIILHPENPGFFNNKIIYEQIPVADDDN